MIKRSIMSIIQMLKADYIEKKDMSKMVNGICIDSRKAKHANLYVPIVGEHFDGHDFIKQAIEKGAIASLWQKNHPLPDVDIPLIIVEDIIFALGNLAKQYREQLVNLKIVGITGSNGKTSTKDMLASICKQAYKTKATKGNYNTEIGVPYTILDFDEDTEVGIVEMGMENLQEISYLTKLATPDVAVITSIGTAHLENLGSVENIVKAKLEIVEGLSNKGVFIYNGDQEMLHTGVIKATIPGSIRILSFGEKQSNDVVLTNYQPTQMGSEFHANKEYYKLDMLGKHQAMNALAAITCAKTLEISYEDIYEGLSLIEKTGLRNEIVNIDHMTIINDSYKSNPQSLQAAIDILVNREASYKIVVLGDMLDLGENSIYLHYEIGKRLSGEKIQEVLTIGNIAHFINQGLWCKQNDIISRHFDDIDVLITYLKPWIHKECTVLIKGSHALHLERIVEALQKEV